MGEQLARDDEFLNLGRALVDAQCPHVPIEPLDGLALRNAAGTEQLHRPIDDALRRFGRRHFCHGGFFGYPLAAVPAAMPRDR